jgi:hypothetical protein
MTLVSNPTHRVTSRLDIGTTVLGEGTLVDASNWLNLNYFIESGHLEPLPAKEIAPVSPKVEPEVSKVEAEIAPKPVAKKTSVAKKPAKKPATKTVKKTA